MPWTSADHLSAVACSAETAGRRGRERTPPESLYGGELSESDKRAWLRCYDEAAALSLKGKNRDFPKASAATERLQSEAMSAVRENFASRREAV